MPSPIQILWIIAGVLAAGVLIVVLIGVLVSMLWPQADHKTTERRNLNESEIPEIESYGETHRGKVKVYRAGGAWSYEQRDGD